jgi:hypothetical protein
VDFGHYRAFGRGWQGDSPCGGPYSLKALALAGNGIQTEDRFDVLTGLHA